MTRISKQPLDSILSEKFFGDFIECLKKANRKSLHIFMGTLLTPTERIMLAKRVAAITLLRDDCPIRDVARMLHMSTSTIFEMKNNLSEGKYDGMFPAMKWSKAEREKFWNALELVLRGGLPRRVGLDRYNWLSKYSNK